MLLYYRLQTVHHILKRPDTYDLTIFVRTFESVRTFEKPNLPEIVFSREMGSGINKKKISVNKHTNKL